MGESLPNTGGSGLAADAADTIFLAGNGAPGPLRTMTGLPTTVATLSGAQGRAVSALAFSPAGVLFGV